MKYTYLFILSALVLLTLTSIPKTSAQQTNRTVLVEQFSNTRCGICANRIPTFWQTVSDFEEDVILLSFYSSTPYSNCELYQASRSLNDERISFYNIFGTPTLHINGERAPTNIWSNAASFLNGLTGSSSEIRIETGFSPSGSHGDGFASVLLYNEFEGLEEFVLHAYLVEKNVTAGTLPSYRNHHNVARIQLTPNTGLPIDKVADIQQNFSFDFEINQSWDNENLAVIAFVQGQNSSEVYNAAKGGAVISNTDAFGTEKKMSLFPNPAKNEITITTATGGKKTLQIFNILGKMVHKMEFDGPYTTINTSHFQRGLYLVRLESGGSPLRTLRLVLE
ncbi:MAG: T9SS C-terminal target domain-containing protein [Saprospirales bacterium]|nr:MAG: T9SS C-terminal target domain-containing protein [Saprospirales bacterium]